MKMQTLSLLASFAIGAGGMSYVVANYQTEPPKPATQYVKSVADEASASPSESPTPSLSTSPEGDDGSQSGPVYNEANTATPTYVTPTIEDTPGPTSEVATDDPVTDSPKPLHTASGSPTQAKPTPPPVIARPTPPAEEVPSGEPTAG